MDLCNQSLPFFHNTVDVIQFPPWDRSFCDKISPCGKKIAARTIALCRLLEVQKKSGIVLSTLEAVMQRVPPPAIFEGRTLNLIVGKQVPMEALQQFLLDSGFSRAKEVRAVGEFSTRGSIVDIFACGDRGCAPIRLDFFDETIESMREFDVSTQLSTAPLQRFTLYPVREVLLNATTIATFKQNCRCAFGNSVEQTLLYQNISMGNPFQGFEHWMPFFYGKLATLFDYLALGATVVAPVSLPQMVKQNYDNIASNHARQSQYPVSKTWCAPPPLASMLLSIAEVSGEIEKRQTVAVTPYALPSAIPAGDRVIDVDVHRVQDLTAVRNQHRASPSSSRGVLNVLRRRLSQTSIPMIIACKNFAIKQHLTSMLMEAGFVVTSITAFRDRRTIKGIGVCVWDIEAGFAAPDGIVFSYGEIFGKRAQERKKARRALLQPQAIQAGELVVHITFGIGRYQGLELVKVGARCHDCLKIAYADNAFIFVPVENMDVVSRYGETDANVVLDTLGGVGWKLRKAKMQKCIGILAQHLVEVAATRHLQRAPQFSLHSVDSMRYLYDQFVARFPFAETIDQKNAISHVLEDLEKQRPMDRIICGDVGFGKTEVALRAAFATVMHGKTVVIIVPTTLLARQHYRVFSDRFKGFSVTIASMSRLIRPKVIAQVKAALQQGTIDIVIATHGILSKPMKIAKLGLLVIDEEHRFGVKQKEALKALKTDVHVLSLSATPIPRTLQMGLIGMREMSLIATPPLERSAVRTFVVPEDDVLVRDVIARECARGGHVFYVCPRLYHLAALEEKLRILMPKARVVTAHGRMTAKDLDAAIMDFIEGKYHILVTTNIIESGIDIPTANTILVHRSDMFGLSSLYQLRGRVGRGKIRGYCYLTTPLDRLLTSKAQRRLQVLQKLDSLGSGFHLANHDLDIRGSGNILGKQQSGYIKNVGVDLYQHMLEKEVARRVRQKNTPEYGRDAERGESKITDESQPIEESQISPRISIDLPVFIPDSYMQDIDQRMAFYRRLSLTETATEVWHIKAEMIDRFGGIPDSVETLCKIIELKILCKRADIKKVEVGDKKSILYLHKTAFPLSERIIAYAKRNPHKIRMRPGNTLGVIHATSLGNSSLLTLKGVIEDLAQLASRAQQGP